MQRSKETDALIGPVIIIDRGQAKPKVRRYTPAMIIDSDGKTFALATSGEVKPFRRKVTPTPQTK